VSLARVVDFFELILALEKSPEIRGKFLGLSSEMHRTISKPQVILNKFAVQNLLVDRACKIAEKLLRGEIDRLIAAGA
jgi:hypothetical protein